MSDSDAPVIGTVITPVRPERVTIIEVPRDRQTQTKLVDFPLTLTQDFKAMNIQERQTAVTPAQDDRGHAPTLRATPEPSEEEVKFAPAPPGGKLIQPTPGRPFYIYPNTPLPGRAASSTSPTPDESQQVVSGGVAPVVDQQGHFAVNTHHSTRAVTVNTRRKVKFEDPEPTQELQDEVGIARAPVQSQTGMILTRHRSLIRNTGAYTTWFSYPSSRNTERPPVLHASVDLEIGDLFIQNYPSQTQRREVMQLWVLQDDVDGSLYWKEARVGETTHPLFPKRILSFQQRQTTAPTWVVANTLRRYRNAPIVVAPGEGSFTM
ncbi:hypothetical protein BV25DRAFT_1921717 [Artomyces pyxidatus]|uniref:Uncharacterized protein n=1 Tax=Artomyces pyxidatus TaxID=48021 RepID=A0ACB8SH59_9AGAM|nr:hypothetical protein BV25DRAFT_1921717 [Artomyces pyxidatus]